MKNSVYLTSASPRSFAAAAACCAALSVYDTSSSGTYPIIALRIIFLTWPEMRESLEGAGAAESSPLTLPIRRDSQGAGRVSISVRVGNRHTLYCITWGNLRSRYLYMQERRPSRMRSTTNLPILVTHDRKRAKAKQKRKEQ